MLNFIKATPEVLADYDVTPSRVLADGDGIKHFELTDNIWILTKDDARVQYWTDEGLLMYIEYVIGDESDTQ